MPEQDNNTAKLQTSLGERDVTLHPASEDGIPSASISPAGGPSQWGGTSTVIIPVIFEGFPSIEAADKAMKKANAIIAKALEEIPGARLALEIGDTHNVLQGLEVTALVWQQGYAAYQARRAQNN